jgi:PmbA protein
MRLELSEASELLERVLAALPPGVEADARLESGEYTTMRFANGWVHQPHDESIDELSLRVAVGDRLGTITTEELGPEGIGRAVREAVSLARAAPAEKKFPGFVETGSFRARLPFSRATATMDPEGLARWTGRLLGTARDQVPRARLSGAVHRGQIRRSVATTGGRLAQSERSVLSARLLVERLDLDPPSTGWAEGAHWDARRLSPERLGDEAAARAAPTPPAAVPAGRYRVLFDGPAAAKLVDELGGLGFMARAAEEGWSCLAHRRGRRIAPEGFSIHDDGPSPLGLPQGIDAEGRPKRRTALVARGTARGPVLDGLTAARMGAAPTGHALPPQSPWGSIGAAPANLVVGPGTARSMEELVRATRRGLLVSRLHYVRTVHPGKGILTGMTRDGTFLIERGEVVGPVRNLRFTESLLTAFRGIELWGRERRCYAGDDEMGGSSVVAPPLLVGAFRFSSATVF